MKNALKIFTISILTLGAAPLFAANDTDNLIEKMTNSKNPIEAKQAYMAAAEAITKKQEYASVPQATKDEALAEAREHANLADGSNDGASQESTNNDGTSTETENDTRADEDNSKTLAEKKQAYEDAKAKEQSKENRMLTAVTTAATGIGGMQLAQGLAEQKADKSAEQDMAAYIATMRCSYANGKSVKAGPEEIELPGGNSAELMSLRNEYFALAADLKERKNALGMKPGIEAEEIQDKAQSGLYDDENTGITTGAYASIYRAQMLGSTTDQEQIDAAKKTSKNRVVGGAIAAGVGVVGGALGNSLINGKLGEKLKEAKEKRNAEKDESAALEELQQCLKSAGVKQTNKLSFNTFTPSVLDLSDIDCAKDLSAAKGKNAQDLFADSDDENEVCEKLIDSFGSDAAYKMAECSTEEG